MSSKRSALNSAGELERAFAKADWGSLPDLVNEALVFLNGLIDEFGNDEKFIEEVEEYIYDILDNTFTNSENINRLLLDKDFSTQKDIHTQLKRSFEKFRKRVGTKSRAARLLRKYESAVAASKLFKPIPATANELLRDKSIQHQINVRRYVQGQVKNILRKVEKADRKLVSLIRKKLNTKRGARTVDALMREVKAMRTDSWKLFNAEVRKTLSELSREQIEAELGILSDSIPFDSKLNTVNYNLSAKAAKKRPFQGRLLKDWFQSVAKADRVRVTSLLTQGIVEGRTTNSIVSSLVGTKANGYTDGVLSVARRDATAVVRTATNHVSNAVREDVWKANKDIIDALVWSATLDGRTTLICQTRDGKATPVVPGGRISSNFEALQPPGARPPAHINCRSFMIPYFDDVGLLGTRGTFASTKTNKELRKEWTKTAKEKAGNNWKSLDSKGKNSLIRKERKEWGKLNVGQVPAKTTYQDFLSRQPATFQDEVLGKTKGKLFRKGGISLDKFVDRNGSELTIEQLRDRIPGAFKKAGL